MICNFLKDPESYGTAKSSGRPKKISSALGRRIIRVVSQDRGRSSRQIKALTDDDCCPITIRRHLRQKGRKNKNVCKVFGCFHVTKWPVQSLLLSTKHGTLKSGLKFCFLTRKKINLDGLGGFQRFWHDKEMPPEMFSMRHSDGGSAMV